MSQEPSDTQEFTDKSSFIVTGIALVVEEKGKGARLVLRYPVKEKELPSNQNDSSIFFTLPPRVMAKLFRPKKPLCGQPMTISVGGTVFCCRAVLLDEKEPSEDNDAKSALILFSVVVALTPAIQTSTIPISGWFEGDTPPTVSPESKMLTGINMSSPSVGFEHVSKSFLTIRRVHVSLVRLCRVLELEERKCCYVSIQIAQMLQINDDFHLKEERKRQTSSANSVNTTPSDSTNVRRHRRTQTPSSGSPATTFTDAIDAAKPTQEAEESGIVEQERDQEIFEIMLSASMSGANIQGNIARELAHVYHAFSRNDNGFPPIPSTILSGRDGIVHINGKVAVPIEAVSGISFLEGMPVVRPYHTLLFPHASASELAASVPSSRLQKLLLMTHPCKSLADICTDAALPLPTVIKMASFLVGHEACIASHVMTKATVLACKDDAILMMQQLTLEFWEEFYHLSIFAVVSMFTSKGLSLGEIIRRTVNGEGEESELIGSVLDAIHSRSRHLNPGDWRAEETNNLLLEETMFALAVWLRAKKVVTTVEEYFVACGLGVNPAWTEDKLGKSSESDQQDERLYLELLESNCLNGNVSTVAMCWKVGLDSRRLNRFRCWGVETGRIISVFRTPRKGDDWDC